MPTMSVTPWPPTEPAKTASPKLNTPPSPATNWYPSGA
jgi:hypothetical protein